jgi:hypothetical protein
MEIELSVTGNFGRISREKRIGPVPACAGMPDQHPSPQPFQEKHTFASLEKGRAFDCSVEDDGIGIPPQKATSDPISQARGSEFGHAENVFSSFRRNGQSISNGSGTKISFMIPVKALTQAQRITGNN